MTTFKNLDFGNYIWSIMAALDKLPRSILGEINNEFEHFLTEHLKLTKNIFPTGTQVFDWIIPKAWRVNNLSVKMPNGSALLEDFDQSKHVVQFSNSFSGILSRSEFMEKINFVEELPESIPYKTSYYSNEWGLNLPYSLVKTLPNGNYEIKLQTEFYDSELHTFEIVYPGKSSREIVFHTYFCHPYMSNDNNSGVALAIAMAKYIQLKSGDHNFSYRFIFVPETIGTIAYIQENLPRLKSNVEKIFVLTTIGDDGPYSIVEAPYSNPANLIANYAWNRAGKEQLIYNWIYRGSDERQYASPGIELPVCTLSRSKFGTFVEYHTFDDNLEYVSNNGVWESFKSLCNLIELCDFDGVYESTTLCEPMLQKRNLYPKKSVRFAHDKKLRDLTTLISLCNGSRTLVDVLKRSEIQPTEAVEIVRLAVENGLIRKIK